VIANHSYTPDVNVAMCLLIVVEAQLKPNR